MTRILIVDDKEENLAYLQALLEGEGYTVESARHGAEALVRARQEPPEVIISDLLMPVMDGYTLLRHWKGDARLKQVPFIVYTATYTEPEDERLALSLGADAFILKPADPDKFLARLREVQAAGPAAPSTLLPEITRDETAILQSYSETLIRKLEQKTLQLQEANRALQEDIAARQRTEAALRASEAQFASAFVHAAVGMALVAPDGRYLRVNRTLCQMFGYPEAELLAITYHDVTHPDDHDDHGAVRRLIAGETDSIQIEKRYLHRDGHAVWGRLSASLLRDETGAPLHLIAQIQDITEPKRTEEALRRSEALFRTLVQTSWDGFHLVDPTGLIIYESPAVTRLLGYQPDDLVGHNMMEFVHHEDAAEMITGGPALADTSGKPRTLTLRVRHKDGGWRWVESYEVNLIDHPDVGAIAVNYHDITERREAESAVHRMAAVVESSADAIIGTDIDGTITSWNAGAAKVFGYTTSEIVGTSIMRLVPPDREEDEIDIMGKIWRGESVANFETAGLTKAGQLIDIAVTASPIRDDDGDVVGVSKIARDITARKKAEAAAADLLTVLEASLNEIYIFDAETNYFEYVNEAALRNLGYSMEEMRQLTPTDLTPEFESEVFPEMTEPLRSHEKPKLFFESEHRRADGTLYPIEAHMQFVERGDRNVFLVVGNDISERKRAKEALEAREAEFRALAEAMPQLVWISSNDGANQYHNRQWLEYTGRAFRGSFGNGSNDAIHPDDRDRVRRTWEVATGAGALYSVECRIRRADGAYRWWLARGVPQRDAAGAILKWFGTCTDVHDLKVAELEIQTLNADLEQRVAQRTAELFAVTQEAEKANLAKSEFLSRTSHELRTPLNAILGFGQLLEIEGRDPEEADSVEQILRAGRHLLELINEMLDISRIEAGELELSLQAVPLMETVSETLALVRPLAIGRGITLEPFESRAHVVVDPQRFKQVVLNLLSNAVKYNRPGGRVRCSVTELSGGNLRFSVTDSGIGIAAADTDKVFTAFGRFGAAATKVEGIGLGLAITRELTELMGGRIGFDSVPGEGSTFWVEFPVAEKAPAAAEAGAEASAHRAPGVAAGSRKLLYIEDNVSNLRLVTRIVARRPEVEFLSAANGLLGLEIARAQRPDMILLDLHLPDLDGGEVLRQLQADPGTADIPVIMLSADALPARRELMLAAGARLFLTKPLEVRAFLAVLDQYLG